MLASDVGGPGRRHGGGQEQDDEVVYVHRISSEDKANLLSVLEPKKIYF